MKQIILIVLIFCEISNAEIVKGPAQIRDIETKKNIVVLYDSVFVTCWYAVNGLYSLSIDLMVLDSEIESSQIDLHNQDFITLKKGTFLRDLQGKRVGEIIHDVDVILFSKNGNLINIGIDGVEIEATSIYPNTDADLLIKEVISKSTLEYHSFAKLFKECKFQNWIDSCGFYSKILYGQALLGPPGVRMITFFDSNELFCIIDNYQLKLSKVKSVSKVREYRVSYFSKNKSRIREFELKYFPGIETAD